MDALNISICNVKPISFRLQNEKHFENPLTREPLISNLISEFKIDKKQSKVAVIIEIDVLSKEHQLNLFNLKAFFEFKVSPLTAVISEQEESTLKSRIAKKLLEIAVDGVRGMLSIYLSDTVFHDFTLPMAHITDDFFD